MSTAVQLVCPECQRENESERIFCHSCGARLDRSILTTVKDEREKPEQAHRRLRNLFEPTNGKLRKGFFALAKVVLGSAIVAALVELALPLNLPPVVKSIGLPAEINFDLERAITSHRAGQFQYTQDQVNGYLAYALKSKKAALDKPLLTFKRLVVGFDENNLCTITIERSLYGYSLYQRAAFEVKLADGKISTANKGAWFGRLPVDPQLMKFGDALFSDAWSALDRERKLLAKMSAIEMHHGAVTITAAQQ